MFNAIPIKILATFFCRYRKDLAVNRNGKGTLKILSSRKVMKTLTKIIKINSFRTLEFNQRLFNKPESIYSRKMLKSW